MSKKLSKLSRAKQLPRTADDVSVGSMPSAKPATSTDSESETVQRADAAAGGEDAVHGSEDYTQRRTMPGLTDYIRPRNIVHWVWSFGENWFLSRPYHNLLIALPFLVVALGGSAFVSWLRTAPLDDLVAAYEAAFETAIRNDDHERAGLYLEGLSAIRPGNNSYRFRLALFELDHGDQNAAKRGLEYLTTQERHLPALRWLVDQAIKPEPVLPIEDDALQQTLLLILNKEPNDLQANRVLADLHIRRGQLQVAEDHLRKVVNKVPALGLPLARVQQAIGRTAEPIERHLNMAEQRFAENLLRDTADNASRLYRAEALTLLSRFEDAERLLKEGLSLEGNGDNPELRSALAVIYATLAKQRLEKSALNIGSATRLLTTALEYSPDNREIIQSIFRIARAGGTFSGDVFGNIIQTLEADNSGAAVDQLLLAQALDMTGATDQALEVALPLAKDRPEHRPLVVRLLQKADRSDEADELIRSMLTEFSAAPDADSAAILKSALRRAEVLFLAKRFRESLAVLDEHPLPDDLKSQQNNPTTRLWNTLYARSCLAVYDDKTKTNSFTNETEALTLLEGALKARITAVMVIDRLAKLSYSDKPIAAQAEKGLTKILASGTASSAVYNLLGTYALQFGKAGVARKHLERALSLKRRDPMVMNNLALAHVRDEAGAPDRALELANEILEIIPEHPDALSTRGEVFAALGRWDEARRDLELALPHQPRSRNTRLLLAKVYTELGQPELSAEHMQIVESIDAETKKPDATSTPN